MLDRIPARKDDPERGIFDPDFNISFPQIATPSSSHNLINNEESSSTIIPVNQADIIKQFQMLQEANETDYQAYSSSSDDDIKLVTYEKKITNNFDDIPLVKPSMKGFLQAGKYDFFVFSSHENNTQGQENVHNLFKNIHFVRLYSLIEDLLLDKFCLEPLKIFFSGNVDDDKNIKIEIQYEKTIRPKNLEDLKESAFLETSKLEKNCKSGFSPEINHVYTGSFKTASTRILLAILCHLEILKAYLTPLSKSVTCSIVHPSCALWTSNEAVEWNNFLFVECDWKFAFSFLNSIEFIPQVGSPQKNDNIQ